MQRTRPGQKVPLLVVAAMALAACGGGDAGAPTTVAETTVAPATTAATTVPSPAPETLPSTSTTAAPTSTAPTTVPTIPPIGLSPDGPWTLVDSAPGITTPGLVYELMPKLWVYLPTEEDLDQGITWTLNEEDRPIIEAYLQARLVFFRATESNPFDFDDPGWTEWYLDGGESYRAVLVPRSERGEIADRADGIVLRPTVIGDLRTDSQAIVWDCMLDGGVWRLPDGSLGPGSSAGIVDNGLSAVLVKTDGRWRAERVSSQPEACW